MRTIEKGKEPPSLRKHRKSGGTYKDYTHADDLRGDLLRDQGHICCYCMQRIALRSMKIEHWASQSEHPDRTVDWDNLLGACPGGDGERDAIRHCDTSRGETSLTVNPLDRARRCEQLIRYLPNGEILSKDPAVQLDIQETLNLNNERLKPKRAQVYDILKHRLERTERGTERGYWPRDMIERELDAWRRLDKEGKYREFCQVAIYFLEKWLKRKA